MLLSKCLSKSESSSTISFLKLFVKVILFDSAVITLACNLLPLLTVFQLESRVLSPDLLPLLTVFQLESRVLSPDFLFLQ